MKQFLTKTELKLYAGPQGGGWFDLAVKLSKALQSRLPQVTIKILPGGGVENPRHVNEGRAQLAMTTDILADAAFRGEPPYSKRISNLVLVGANLSTLPFYMLRRLHRPFAETLSKGGLRIAVPERDTADALTFQRMLSFFGESTHSVHSRGGSVLYGDYRTIANAICEGEVDFLFGATTLPANVIRFIERTAPQIRLDSLPEELVAWFVSCFGYRRTTIPSGSYPTLQDLDLETIGMETVIVGSDTLDETLLAAVNSVLSLDHRGLS